MKIRVNIEKIQVVILESLCLYKQLTIPQMVSVIHFDASTQKIRRHLSQLFVRKRPLVQRVEYKRIAHFGKLSYVYSITKLGVTIFQKHRKDKIQGNLFTPYRPSLTDDYFHRTSTIDFHLALRLSASKENFEVQFCTEYFAVKKILNSFISINKINFGKSKHIIPDLVFSLRKNLKDRLFLFELHNGKDKGRIKEQIKEHALLLVSLSCHKKYGLDSQRFYYILLLFEETSTFKAVIKDISKDNWYKNIAQFFLCKHLGQSEDSFLNGWTNLSGEPSNIKF